MNNDSLLDSLKPYSLSEQIQSREQFRTSLENGMMQAYKDLRIEFGNYARSTREIRIDSELLQNVHKYIHRDAFPTGNVPGNFREGHLID